MSDSENLSLDRLLDVLAEKLANRLSKDQGRLYPRLLTVEQAATYLGRTPEAIRSLTTPGKIPTICLERSLFIDRFDLDEWIEDNKVGWANTARSGSERRRYGS